MRPSWRGRQSLSDIIQWDVATWKDGLLFWDRKVEDFDGRLGLELGSRDGGLSLFLALKGCRVICSDLNGPTPRAKELHCKYGVDDLVSYECIDARTIPFAIEHFDLVVLKSVLGALPNADDNLAAQREAVAEIHRVLKPGGRLLIAENMRGSAMHSMLRRRFTPWGDRWHYFTEAEIDDLLSDFTTVDLCFRGFAATLGRREWQRTLLHHLDRVMVPVLPTSLRYVVFGVAVK